MHYSSYCRKPGFQLCIASHPKDKIRIYTEGLLPRVSVNISERVPDLYEGGLILIPSSIKNKTKQNKTNKEK
jgi:hypothetical protein